jgi:AAA family ATP:ADP antiporter
VEPGEARMVVALASSVFLLLTSYYLLKTAREPLILLHGGAEVKSYAAAGQSLLLLAVVPAYAALARRAGRLRLLLLVYGFFIANLLAFAALAGAGANIAVVFYLWVGIFSNTAVAQFWSLAADIYMPDQGKRLFAILGIGMSTGALAGARIANALVSLGPEALMLAAAGLLALTVVVMVWAERHARATPHSAAAPPPGEPLARSGMLKRLGRDRYLVLIAALTLLLNWVNSNGEYLLDRTLLASFGADVPEEEAMKLVGAFKADYFGWVNLVGMLLQLFLVSRIFAVVGVRSALYFLPAVAFVGYGLLLVAPILSLVRVAKIAENSLDYSVQNTARQALYLVASREEKYVGKQAIDTFFVRVGDVLSALCVWAGSLFGLPTAAFASLNLLLVGGWLVVVVAIGREHGRRRVEADALAQKAPVPT